MDQTLAILRQPEGLVALLSQQPDTLDFAPDTLSDAAVERAAAGHVAVRPVPLAVVSDAPVPGRAPLLAAWRALAQVARFDGETLFRDGKTWQICDITDPVLKGFIDSAPLRDDCDVRIRRSILMRFHLTHTIAGFLLRLVRQRYLVCHQSGHERENRNDRRGQAAP